jgi:sulfoxide reductase heme-binding subunit YedZ
MTPDLIFWILARITGLASFAALSIAVLTGVALRTAVLDWLSTNRAIRSTHEFTSVLWLPLGTVHVLTLLFDQTARLTVLDVVVPFMSGYYTGSGRLAVALGTISLDIFVVVAITSWLRSRMSQRLWRWIHRLSYVAFAVLFLHAVLGGTDFSAPLVSALAWGTAFGIALISLARLFWGRLPA